MKKLLKNNNIENTQNIKRDFPHPKFESLDLEPLIADQGLDIVPRVNFYIINENTQLLSNIISKDSYSNLVIVLVLDLSKPETIV